MSFGGGVGVRASTAAGSNRARRRAIGRVRWLRMFGSALETRAIRRCRAEAGWSCAAGWHRHDPGTGPRRRAYEDDTRPDGKRDEVRDMARCEWISYRR